MKNWLWQSHILEKIGLNNFFGNIIKTEWISGIDIDKKREAEIQSYFSKTWQKNKMNLIL